MQSHYEQREERTSHDYDQVYDSYDTLSPSITTSTTTAYRSAVGPRVNTFSRSRPTGLGVGTRMYQNHQSTGFGGGGGGASQSFFSSLYSQGVPLRGGAVAINTMRQRDKRDLETLNDKFAQYVEKVRFLEAHNRKLAMELEVLRNRTGQYVLNMKTKNKK
jgi:intermediate filament protein if